MTDMEITDLADFYFRQFGGSEEDALATIKEWNPVFVRRGLTYAKIKDAMMRVMEDGPPVRKDTRLSAILRACGTTTKVAEVHVYCAICKNVGGEEVPHPNDYGESGIWKGTYMVWARCLCGHGNKFGPCLTLPFYESRFPNWRDDYPSKMYERQMLELQAKIDDPKARPEDVTRHESALAFIRGLYDALFVKPVPPTTGESDATILPFVGEVDSSRSATLESV